MTAATRSAVAKSVPSLVFFLPPSSRRWFHLPPPPPVLAVVDLSPVGRCRALPRTTLFRRPAAPHLSSPVFCVRWWFNRHLRIRELLQLLLLLPQQQLLLKPVLLLVLLLLLMLLLLLVQQLYVIPARSHRLMNRFSASQM